LFKNNRDGCSLPIRVQRWSLLKIALAKRRIEIVGLWDNADAYKNEMKV
jgi:hypothetical protein